MRCPAVTASPIAVRAGFRSWLAVVEAAGARRYYHSSARPLEIGTLLHPVGANLLDGDIEATLEAQRPPTKLARAQAVFMTANLRDLESLTTHAEPHVYRVAPTAPPLALDHAWIHAMWTLFARNENAMTADVQQKVDAYAHNYWAGVRSTFGYLDPPLWEFLAVGARVIAAVRGNRVA